MKEVKSLSEALEMAKELGMEVKMVEFESQDVRAFKNSEDFKFVEIWRTNMNGSDNVAMGLVVESLRDRGLIRDLQVEWSKVEVGPGHFAVVPVKIEVEER